MIFTIDNINPEAWTAMGIALAAALWLVIPYRNRVLSPAKLAKKQAATTTGATDQQWPDVSLIIYSAGNVESLENILTRAHTQNYNGRVEIVVVNDGTSGDTADVLTRYSIAHPERDVYYTHVPDQSRNLSRKKLCLSLGIKAARHDVVVFTHAECTPASDSWLREMVRPIAEGKDISLGYGYIANLPGTLNRFDEAATAMQWISAAISGNPLRGCSFNLAYRKELFFKAKGFAKSLSLHYGDDDLFINQIANSTNTAMVLNPGALMAAELFRPAKWFRESRLFHCYTARKLRGTLSTRVFFGVSMAAFWLWLAAGAVAVCLTLPNLLPTALMCALLLTVWILTVNAWLRTGKALGINISATLLPVNMLLKWVRTQFWRATCGLPSRRNHTWC